MVNAATADLTSLAQRFRDAGKNAPVEMDRVMNMWGDQILERMRSYSPVKTGRLRNSMRKVSAPNRVQIGPVDVDYDIYQEYGTGTRGEFGQARSSKTSVARLRRGGSTYTVVLNGNRPHPYARPAFKDVMNKALPDASGMGVQLILGGPGGQ